MKSIIHIVDSHQYVETNCFQHQLLQALHDECGETIVTVDLLQALSGEVDFKNVNGVISTLKQRTLMRHAAMLRVQLDDTPLVVYDQDPWESYMDGSEYKGAYDVIMKHLNVKVFALTTKWWVDFLREERGLSTTFVRMWMLPRYCKKTPDYVARKNLVGFVGTVHPRRRELLNVIESADIKTSVLNTSSLAYPSFLEKLSELRCFVHNEDMPFTIDGQPFNFNTGMWIKDVEAISQGCFSIRSRGQGHETYLDGVDAFIPYDHINEVPGIIRRIEGMDPVHRQGIIDRSVALINVIDVWRETARELIDQAIG